MQKHLPQIHHAHAISATGARTQTMGTKNDTNAATSNGATQ